MERPTIFTKPSQTGEPETATVNRESGGSVHPTLGGGYVLSPAMVGLGTALEGSAV
jgi:hypothetical protein